MSLIMFEGYDTYVNVSTFPQYIDFTGGRYGNASMRYPAEDILTNPVEEVIRDLLVGTYPSNDRHWVGWAQKVGDSGGYADNNHELIYFVDSSAPDTQLITLIHGATDGDLEIWYNYRVGGLTGSGTLLGTIVGAFPDPDEWHYLELGVVWDDTTFGEVYLYLDNALVFSDTGIDTGTSTQPDGCVTRVTYDAGSQSAILFKQDDLYILNANGALNNTRLGPRKVVVLLPTGDIPAEQDFTDTSPAFAAHYTTVNFRTGWGGTRHVDDDPATVGHREMFVMEDLPLPGGAVINGVYLQTQAGLLTNMSPPTATLDFLLRQAGNEWLGNPLPEVLPIATQVYQLTTIFEYDLPYFVGTASQRAWTSYVVNSMVGGFEVVAQTNSGIVVVSMLAWIVLAPDLGTGFGHVFGAVVG